MTLAQIRDILAQAHALEGVESVYFEGGEPFLYYPILLESVHMARTYGFGVGIVTNSYWATAEEDALEWLRPLVGMVEDLSVSSDLFHYDQAISQQARNAQAAAEKLGLPIGVISIAQPEAPDSDAGEGQIPLGESAVMYRGRATVNLAPRVPHSPWESFTACPHEDLREPGRVHVDPLGYVHLCQGLCLGNLFNEPLAKICARYDPDSHPVSGPLLQGGPAELVRRYDLPHRAAYADACHLCYEARIALRTRFPEILAPDQVYGG